MESCWLQKHRTIWLKYTSQMLHFFVPCLLEWQRHTFVTIVNWIPESCWLLSNHRKWDAGFRGGSWVHLNHPLRPNYIIFLGKFEKSFGKLKESIRKRIFGPVHIHLDVTVRVTNQIPTIYPIISTQSSIENYAQMRFEWQRLPPYLFTCDVTHSLSVESHLQAIVLHFIYR